MKKISIQKIIGFFILIILPFTAEAAEMADTLRQSGKIYVVVAVLGTILLILLLYLLRIEVKLNKLEKEINKD